jgi:broad specificity phosphatase PhoE
MRLLTLAAALAFAALSTAGAQQSPTVVIIVRHAEKAAAPANDPPLTDAGAARARALVTALADANVQAVITTMETVPTGAAAAHAQAVADAVRKHAGKTVLVVGHSNTVTPIIAALGGPKLADLCDSQYSNLYTVVLDGAAARLVVGTYGEPSPAVATGCPQMK